MLKHSRVWPIFSRKEITMMYEATDHSNQPLVLAVDDDMTLRLMMREALEQAGFAVAEAENGQQALALYEQLQPAIVLLDVLMPELDGFKTCAALRGLPGGADTPVLMVTGLDDIDSINRAYEVGATDFLTKPITWGLLGHRVRYLLRSSKAFEKLRNSEEALQTAHAEFEKRVQERTADLATANARLQQECKNANESYKSNADCKLSCFRSRSLKPWAPWPAALPTILIIC
jgi:PleD family two-component response regulator